MRMISTQKDRQGELTHRLITQLSLASILLLALSPIIGHHLRGIINPLFSGGSEHIAGLCVVALQELLSPVHHFFHVLLAIGLVYAFYRWVRIRFRSRTVLRGFQWRSPQREERIFNACQNAGVCPSAVRIVEEMANPAFTVGFWNPKIYLCRRGLLALDDAELTAVIAHEKAHAQRNDPFWFTWLRFASHVFFWLPAIADLATDFTREEECVADDHAAGSDPVILASAILKMARTGSHRIPLSAAFASEGRGMIEYRVRRLIGSSASAPRQFRARSSVPSLCLLALLWASAIFAAPGADIARVNHCAHHHGLAIFHIFCEHTQAKSDGNCHHG